MKVVHGRVASRRTMVAGARCVLSPGIVIKSRTPRAGRRDDLEADRDNSPILHAVAPAYWHGTSTVPLIGHTIGENLRETARRFPDHEALVVPFQGVRLTDRDFDSAVDRLRSRFLSAGIAKGDRIGIWSPHNPERVLHPSA